MNDSYNKWMLKHQPIKMFGIDHGLRNEISVKPTQQNFTN